MSPAERLQLAHRAAGQAISELVCADNEVSPAVAARLVAWAAIAVVRSHEGSQATSETLYAHADAMVGTR